MFNWYKKVVFENYANFNGRARRSEYWYFFLLNMIFTVTAMIIDKSIGLTFGLQSVYSIALFIPALAVSVRRLHDVSKSGWLLLVFYLLLVITVAAGFITGDLVNSGSNNGMTGFVFVGALFLVMSASAVWMLVLHCMNGNEGVNKYGSDPKSSGDEINEIGTA